MNSTYPFPMSAADAPPQNPTHGGDDAATTLADPEPTCGPAPTTLIPVVSLRLIRERTLAYGPQRVNTAADVHVIFRELIGDNDREALWVMCLDSKNKITCLSMISVGTLNASLVHPRELFKVAILSNARAVIVAHNHPSGDPTPSGDDERLTRQLRDAGHLLQIELLDHVIIGDGRYFSFQEEGR